MEIIIAKRAQKIYKNLPKLEQKKVKKKLLGLADNPLSGKKLEGKLKNRRVVRAWPYRIIYSINDDLNRVEISDILHRQGAYK